MERLTDWINEEKTEVSIRHDRFRDAMIRLAAYEDTGLEPCEIPVLLDRLKRASEQWNIWYDAYQKDVPEWIPVAERLPEETQVSEFPSMKPLYKESDECLVTFRTEKNLYVGFDNTVDGEWIQSDDVIAWMPKPEPFNPQN